MRARVFGWKRNVDNEIEIEKITLIAGKNRQGKTGMAEAIGVALVGPAMGSDFKNSRVRVGTKGAKVKVEDGDKAVSVSLPSGARDLSGGWDKHVSEVAAWLKDPAALNAKDFNELLQKTLKTEPTLEDLTGALKDYDYTKADIDAIWKAIIDGGKSGWSSTFESYSTTGTRLKGQWLEVTSHKGTYGKNIAADWIPQNWEADLAQSSADSLEKDAAFEATQTEAMIRDSAINDDEYSKLQEKWLGADIASGIVQAAIHSIEVQQKLVEEAQAALDATPKTENIKEPDKKTCAYCDKTNLLVNGKWIKTEDHKAPSQKEVAEATKKRADAHAVVVEETNRLNVLKRALIEAENNYKEAAEAGVRLAHSVKANGADEKKLEEQREHAARATRRLAAFRKWSRAREIHASIERNQVLIDALSPKGLKKAALTRSVQKFNTSYLKPICEIAGWGLVEVHDDLTVTQDHTLFEPSSGAERFCMRVSLQAALAKADGSQFMIIDGADILDGELKGCLMQLLEVLSESMPILVTMTMNEPSDCPDFEEIGLGQSYWIEEGVTRSLSKAAV